MFTESAQSLTEASPPVGAPSPLRIVSCGPTHGRRAEAEAFVRERFLRTHGAVIQSFMPDLLVLTGGAGEVVGVTGCRPAAGQPLFLERYFDGSIEERLARHTGARVKRAAVVEIGNFACRDPRIASRFMSLLPRHLLDSGFTWVTFTATASIRRILRQLGARCADLGAADGACVRGTPDQWGRYYATEPRVMAGYLPLARRIPQLWSTQRAD